MRVSNWSAIGSPVPAGIAVRDPGGQLLERHVRERSQDVLVVDRLISLRHVHHAQLLEFDRVDGAGDCQIVAQSCTMPAFLGGPAVDPVAPRLVTTEEHRDLVVIARQVVLRQQVDDQRGPSHVGEFGVGLHPRVTTQDAVEVATVAPRDVLVGEPLLGDRDVSVEFGFDHGVEFEQELGLTETALR